MALEDLTGPNKFITALVNTNPLSADDRREGDDHIRGIKNVLHNTFPELDGAIPGTATEINAGLTGGAGAVQRAGDTMTGALVVVDPANVQMRSTGGADYSSLAFGVNSQAYIASGKGGAGVAMPLVIYGPGVTIDPPTVLNAGLTVNGDAVLRGSILEIGGGSGNGNAAIDFHTGSEDFTYRLAMWGASPGVLRVEHSSGQAMLHIEGNQSGLASGDNIDDVPAAAHRVAFGWRNDATLGLRVDGTQFGATWPISVQGNCAGTAQNANTLQGNGPTYWPAADNCANVGFESGDSNKPYMRYQASATVRQLIWNTSHSNEPWSIRDSSDGGGRYLETAGTAGAFGVRYNVSDVRLKENVQPSTVDALEVVRAMEFIEYDWGPYGFGTGHVPLGLSAQNLQALSPGLVMSIEQPPETPLSEFGSILQLNEGAVLATLAKALQQALARIEQLESLAAGV